MTLAPRVSCVFLVTVVLGQAAPADAQSCGTTPNTLIVLDRSGSMSQNIGFLQSKWSQATWAINNLTKSFAGQLGFGLMMFPNGTCGAGNVNVAPGNNTAGAISTSMLVSFPRGNTPIGSTLLSARTYLAGKGNGYPQYVILVTDGMETCNGDPIGAASALRAAAIKTYVVGFGSGVNPGALQALAQAGGTGTYLQADNSTQLNNALQAIAKKITCCGNGKLDFGEKCDTAIASGPGSCPKSCNDNNPCTADSLAGGACNSTCKHTPILLPKNGDGCCPPGANSGNDSDCPAGCGNGVLDKGEACDTKIPPGQKGACPTSCDDNDPCTADRAFGGGCTKVCQHANTCGKNCGDGKLDPGEACDRTIPAGQPGACPHSCDDGDKCTVDSKVGAGCQVKCEHKAVPNSTTKDGCCAPGVTSKDDPDCPPPCGPDRTTNCVDPCAKVTCPDQHYCKFGTCTPWSSAGGGGSGSGGNSAVNQGGGNQDISGGCACDTGAGGGDSGGALALTLLLGVALLSRRRR